MNKTGWMGFVVLSGVALGACADSGLTAPRGSVLGAGATRSRSAADALEAATPEIVVAHGTHGRVYHFSIVGNTVTADDGRHHVANAQELATLRKIGNTDRRVEQLAAIFKKTWQHLNLPDDGPDVQSHGAGKAPHRSLLERPKAPHGGLDSHTNLIVCDEYDDCYDDGSDDTGGDSGWPDNCTNLYIDLYDETQTWHHDMDGYNTAVAMANYYQCGTFDAYGQPVYPETCAVLLVDVAGWALWVQEDIGYLNDTAYSLTAAGCTAH
jgi:hypothetical protein